MAGVVIICIFKIVYKFLKIQKILVFAWGKIYLFGIKIDGFDMLNFVLAACFDVFILFYILKIVRMFFSVMINFVLDVLL